MTKRAIETVIQNKIPVHDFMNDVLVFKNYYISDFKVVTNPVITKLKNNELCLSIMANLIKEDQCSLMYCGEATLADTGVIRVPILFFDTYIFAGISFDNNIAYCLLNPIIESIGLSTFDGLSANIHITSVIVGIQRDKNREEIKDLLYRDTDLIIRKLMELSNGTK